MTIEYTNPSSRDIKEKEYVAPRVSSKRNQVKTTEEPKHYGSYHSGPQFVYQPFANLKLRQEVSIVIGEIKIAKAIVWAILIFLVSAIIESIIAMWMFKKFGGCPLQPKHKKGE